MTTSEGRRRVFDAVGDKGEPRWVFFFFFGQVQWRDSEGIGRRTLRSRGSEEEEIYGWSESWLV